ncbi:MAG: hypothetical protein E6K80_12560 [Candidatus Eisenbacteria bacterium]|uniref:DUF4142 domain-containing protein n=1 Tax=Eiseniibacteriota bacterium TaxID=2212470 RepID=A0A538TZT9_UNCEI|nr:MAG: hypothetical protein E6K80_12560 [Candidatus Eisenbacteria bacterium]
MSERGRMSWAIVTAVALACAAGVLAPPAARAQAIDRHLLDRLDPATGDEVWKIAETARQQGVPYEPLLLTAAEGASKHASRERILAAVRERYAALSTAKDALGPESTPSEIAAGAGALMSGVSPDTLAKLRQWRPKGSLLVPLVVLADLVTRHVPVETASSALLHASRIGAKDADLLRLRSRIESDIQKGVSPAAATLSRLQGLGAGPPGAPLPGGSR